MIYLESPANPTNALVDVEAVRAARDARSTPDETPIAIDNTFLGPAVAEPAQARRRHRRLFADQVRRRPLRPRRRQRLGGQALDRPGAQLAQHDGRHLRSEHRVDAAAQPRDARNPHAARDRERHQGVRFPQGSPQGREASASSGCSRTAARRTSTTATAAARAAPFSLFIKGGEAEASASSTRSR